MRLERILPMLVIVALAQSACGPSPVATSSSTAGETPPTTGPPEAQSTSPPEPAAAVDVSSFVACEIVAAQDVADRVGGPIFRELEQEPGPGCLYEVEAGPDGYAQFIVTIQPTSLIESLIEVMPDELARPVAGMGDAAYLEYDEAADTYDLIVLVRDRFGLEVVGEGEDWTLSIGELFLSRLLGP